MISWVDITPTILDYAGLDPGFLIGGVPRDFDVSPYFTIIKPTIEHGFDPYSLTWESTQDLKYI